MSNFKLNGYTIESIADLNRLFAEIDAGTMQLWGHPLPVESLQFLLRQIKTKTESETVRNEIDARLRKLAQNTTVKTESQKQLETAWQRREERARELGYDISDDDETDKEPTEAMKAVWRERERKNEEMNRK